MMSGGHSNFMIYVYVYMSFCKFILCIYFFTYLILFIGRVAVGLIPLTNIWRDIDM